MWEFGSRIIILGRWGLLKWSLMCKLCVWLYSMWDYTCLRAGSRITARRACIMELVTGRSVCLTFLSCFIMSSRPVAYYRYFTDCCGGCRVCLHVCFTTNRNKTLVTNQSAFAFLTRYTFNPPPLTDKEKRRLKYLNKVANLNSHYNIPAQIILLYYSLQNSKRCIVLNSATMNE